MSEQTKPVSKPDDQTKTTGPRTTKLTEEELDRVAGGFSPVDGITTNFGPIDGNPFQPIDGKTGKP